MHDTFPIYRTFEWQEGYGAFTIGKSQGKPTTEYIQNQQEHHRERTYEEELLAILERHEIEYDPRFVFG